MGVKTSARRTAGQEGHAYSPRLDSRILGHQLVQTDNPSFIVTVASLYLRRAKKESRESLDRELQGFKPSELQGFKLCRPSALVGQNELIS